MHSEKNNAMFSLGEAEIFRVEEFSQPLPLALFKVDAAIVAANLNWLTPSFINVEKQTFPLVFQTWVVRIDDQVVVIDPCNGNGRNRPVLQQFHQLNTPFMERFAATGIRPEQVDLVFCTHLHCDHCGWNTHLRDGRWVPTFPNARYVFVRREAERWDPRRGDHQVVEFNEGAFEDSVLPIMEAGLADLVESRHQLSPALQIEPAYGHTAGHSILRLTTRAGELIFTGDAFHHPLQILDTSLYFDLSDDLAAAIATRNHLRTLIADRGALMLPAHFPAPHGGRVLRAADGFTFAPFDVPCVNC